MPKRLNRRIADPQTGHDCYSEDSAQQALLAALQAHHFPNQAMGAMSDRAVDPGNGLRSQIPPYCCTRRPTGLQVRTQMILATMATLRCTPLSDH